jgi:sugar phosphate isomerase/epimerase
MATTKDDIFAISRRDVLTLGASGLVLAGAPGVLAAAAPRRIPIALQLYSVRGDCAKDFDGTLAKVAEMGFEGVEFAGYHSYAKNPDGLRKKLDQLKLKAAGTHIGAGSFAPDKLQETVAFHKTIGCRFLIVPGDKRFTDPDGSKEYAKAMTDAAAALKAHGLSCGHHNHTGEFKAADGGKTYWDLFAERTSKDVILQQDMGWTTMAGLVPAELVRRYPGRTKTCHIKPKVPKGVQGKNFIIGQDATDWKSAIRACQEVGGTEWLTVEQEDYPDGLSPLDATKKSLDGLKKILAEMKA